MYIYTDEYICAYTNIHTYICIYICMCRVSTAIELFLQTVADSQGE